MAQRDQRTRELLDMLAHRSIQRLLVVNAASQGETIEDVMQSYGAAQCRGAVLSKIDEAVKTAPALDALIRHKLRVVGVANGQRVPEDWHRLSSQALVQRALRAAASPAWRVEPGDVNLLFAAAQRPVPPAAAAAWR
jgi:flagellar biosynthesis protein FlhF